jgi:peptidoglycan/LPS O-acetylase OafA/YrhL
MTRTWSRIDGVDLLRGLSIVLVLMNHVNMRLVGAKIPYTRGLPDQLVSSLVWNGQFAVQMFFVISGYLITSTSIRRWKNPARLRIKDFYLLRFARIAPLMILLLLVLSVLHLAGVPHYVVAHRTGGLGRALFAALTFHIGWLEATRGYLPGNWDILWSLSVEEMFYLFFPLIARVFRKPAFLVPILALFVIAGPFSRAAAFNPNPVWREYSYLGGMDAIALGCLTAIVFSGLRMTRGWIFVCGVAGSIVLMVSLDLSLRVAAWGLQKNGLDCTVLAVGVCLVIAAASQSCWRAPRFLTPLLVLGQRSYEIYLTHMFIVFALFGAFIHFGSPMAAVPVLFAVVIVVSGALGWLVSVVYAEPMNHFIRARTGTDKSSPGVATPEAD